MDCTVTRQNRAESYFQCFRSLFDELVSEKTQLINTLMGQNLFIDGELNYNFNPCNENNFNLNKKIQLPMEDTERQTDFESGLLKLDQANQLNLFSQNSDNQKSEISLPNQINYKSQNNLSAGQTLQKTQNNNFKNFTQTKLSSSKTQKPSQKPSYYRKPQSGRLQDIPGNPLENRLITEFFQKQAPKIINFTGNKQNFINKKEMLACYIKWRLKQLPSDTKLKLVNIQVCISGYIRTNLKSKCEPLRHCYNGMEFKSISTVKQIRSLNLDNYKVLQKRGRRPEHESKGNFNEGHMYGPRRVTSDYYQKL